ncbi:MAG: Gfo/Idh/MocA family oxidoreductase, partial [Pseudomonadota bacterium]
LNKERAQSVVGENPVAVTDSFEQVLADDSIDLIDVCLPPNLHLSAIVSALEAGKNVISEKPLVASIAEADQVLEACQRTGRHVFPVFQYRYGPGLDKLKALVDGGLAGKAYSASLETHWNRGSDYYSVPWRGTWEGESGGAVLGHAIHIHDLLSFILGPIQSVTALTATRVNPIEVEDCAAIAFELSSGAVATSSVTLGAGTDTSRLRFCFEGFTATSGTNPYAPGQGAWTFEARAPMDQSHLDSFLNNLTPRPAWFAGFFKAVAMALDGHPGREVTLEDGRRSLEVVTAVYHSARTGHKVALPIDKEHPLYSGWQPEPLKHQQQSQQQQ